MIASHFPSFVLCGKRNFLALAAGFDDQVSVVIRELLVGVQEFDPVNRAVRRDIDIDFIADFQSGDWSAFLVKLHIGNVGLRVVAQFHVEFLQKKAEGHIGIIMVRDCFFADWRYDVAKS